jgi:hypothetical protein
VSASRQSGIKRLQLSAAENKTAETVETGAGRTTSKEINSMRAAKIARREASGKRVD